MRRTWLPKGVKFASWLGLVLGPVLVALGSACAEAKTRIAADNVCAPVASASKPEGGHAHLVVHEKLGKPVIVDGCTRDAGCREWARFSLEPPRAVIDVQLSPSGEHFFVWSRPDGHARELDLFETPSASHATALPIGHVTPGFGGELRWVSGDRLWHWWGCGTSCIVAQLRDATGAIRVTQSGSLVETAPDATRAVVADYGGAVVWVDFVTGTSFTVGPSGSLLFPTGVTFEKDAVRVAYETSSGTVTLDCSIVASSGFACRTAPSPSPSP